MVAIMRQKKKNKHHLSQTDPYGYHSDIHSKKSQIKFHRHDIAEIFLKVALNM